jgi:hypothetical protein
MTVTQAPYVNPRVEFWSDDSCWPRDASGVSFLGRIVHHLGRVVYGKEWTGYEPATTVVYPIRAHLSAETSERDIRWACELLRDDHPGYRLRCEAAAKAGEPRPMPTPDEWAVAHAWSEKMFQFTETSRARYFGVINVLLRVFEQGIVKTYLRPSEAGHIVALTPGEWFNECFLAWFATCQVHPQHRFSRTPIRYGGDWIYVDRDSYLAWLALAFDTVGQKQPDENAQARTATVAAPQAQSAEPETSQASEPPGGLSRMPAAPPDADQPAKTKQRRRRTGARRKFAWDDFKAEVVRRVQKGDAPPTVHQFADEMALWCSETWGKEPSNSRLRYYIEQALAENGLSLDVGNAKHQ